MKRTLAALLLLVPLSVAAGLQPRHYEPRLDQARWAVTASPLVCTLSQAIPTYGRAVFTRRAGKNLAFHIEVERTPHGQGSAQVRALPPSWKHDGLVRAIGTVSYRDNKSPFAFDASLSRQMLAELEQGMFPTLYYTDWADRRGQVSVSISAVKFRPSLEKFLRCTQALLPYNFDSLRDSMFHLASDQYRVTGAAKRRLDDVVNYLKLDPQVSRVVIDAYTDDVGTHRYNYLLSRRRAFAVRDYLLAAKVPQSKIKARFHGQRKPVATNKTAAGRADNRRVWVRLLR